MSEDKSVYKQFPPKQELAAQLLAQGTPAKEVAQQVGISLSLVYKWKNTPAFIAHVNQLLHTKEVDSYQELFALKAEAIDTLKAMLNSKDSRTALKAVELLMKFGT